MEIIDNRERERGRPVTPSQKDHRGSPRGSDRLYSKPPTCTRKYNFSLIMHATERHAINHPGRGRASRESRYQRVRFIESAYRIGYAEIARFDNSTIPLATILRVERNARWIVLLKFIVKRRVKLYFEKFSCIALILIEETNFKIIPLSYFLLIFNNSKECTR